MEAGQKLTDVDLPARLDHCRTSSHVGDRESFGYDADVDISAESSVASLRRQREDAAAVAAAAAAAAATSAAAGVLPGGLPRVAVSSGMCNDIAANIRLDILVRTLAVIIA
jgi:hypothetical protein